MVSINVCLLHLHTVFKMLCFSRCWLNLTKDNSAGFCAMCAVLFRFISLSICLIWFCFVLCCFLRVVQMKLSYHLPKTFTSSTVEVDYFNLRFNENANSTIFIHEESSDKLYSSGFRRGSHAKKWKSIKYVFTNGIRSVCIEHVWYKNDINRKLVQSTTYKWYTIHSVCQPVKRNWINIYRAESNRGDGVPHQNVSLSVVAVVAVYAYVLVYMPNIHCSEILRHHANRVHAYKCLKRWKLSPLCGEFVLHSSSFSSYFLLFFFIVVWCVSVRYVWHLNLKSLLRPLCLRCGIKKREMR